MTKEKLEQLLKSQPYRKPEIKKEAGLQFPKQILDKLGTGCHQCTSCHSCH